MRRRSWVLYTDSQYAGRELYLYIIKDIKTPHMELEALPHCLGIYASYEAAVIRARGIIEQRIHALKSNLKRLESIKTGDEP